MLLPFFLQLLNCTIIFFFSSGSPATAFRFNAAELHLLYARSSATLSNDTIGIVGLQNIEYVCGQKEGRPQLKKKVVFFQHMERPKDSMCQEASQLSIPTLLTKSHLYLQLLLSFFDFAHPELADYNARIDNELFGNIKVLVANSWLLKKLYRQLSRGDTGQLPKQTHSNERTFNFERNSFDGFASRWAHLDTLSLFYIILVAVFVLPR